MPLITAALISSIGPLAIAQDSPRQSKVEHRVVLKHDDDGKKHPIRSGLLSNLGGTFEIGVEVHADGDDIDIKGMEIDELLKHAGDARGQMKAIMIGPDGKQRVITRDIDVGELLEGVDIEALLEGLDVKGMMKHMHHGERTRGGATGVFDLLAGEHSGEVHIEVIEGDGEHRMRRIQFGAGDESHGHWDIHREDHGGHQVHRDEHGGMWVVAFGDEHPAAYRPRRDDDGPNARRRARIDDQRAQRLRQAEEAMLERMHRAQRAREERMHHTHGSMRDRLEQRQEHRGHDRDGREHHEHGEHRGHDRDGREHHEHGEHHGHDRDHHEHHEVEFEWVYGDWEPDSEGQTWQWQSMDHPPGHAAGGRHAHEESRMEIEELHHVIRELEHHIAEMEHGHHGKHNDEGAEAFMHAAKSFMEQIEYAKAVGAQLNDDVGVALLGIWFASEHMPPDRCLSLMVSIMNDENIARSVRRAAAFVAMDKAAQTGNGDGAERILGAIIRGAGTTADGPRMRRDRDKTRQSDRAKDRAPRDGA